jgi:hypothetical protein
MLYGVAAFVGGLIVSSAAGMIFTQWKRFRGEHLPGETVDQAGRQ